MTLAEMKKPLIISLAVIIACAVPAILQQRHLSQLRETQQNLLSEAAKLGISNISTDASLSKQEREAHERQARALPWKLQRSLIN
ncbi:MAG: hypothetical protein HC845_11110 [Akkermansiaceae bacterium]|nr:hypothetical protein [Akkermansiaceae bacterium]